MKEKKTYNYRAASVAGFLQVLAANYLPSGYLFYSEGKLRDGADRDRIAHSIVARYGIDASKDVRYRRKKLGVANLQLLMHDSFYLILATEGRHKFFEREVGIRDARRHPIHFEGYTVSVRAGRSSVRLSPEMYRMTKAYFEAIACTRPGGTIARDFADLGVEAYKPVISQVRTIWRAVNKKRAASGYAPVPDSCIRTRRRVCRPFEATGDRLVPAPDSVE